MLLFVRAGQQRARELQFLPADEIDDVPSALQLGQDVVDWLSQVDEDGEKLLIEAAGEGEFLSPKMAKADPLDIENYKHAVQMLAFGNTVPFVGPLTVDSDIKKFLFCLHDKDCLVIPPHGYQLLVIAQNIVSIILVFFIGLALRNYFKIK
jgi:hypothetical protein